MPTSHALMALLARGERYGYQLRRELEGDLGPEWRLDFGQLYRALASMKRKGWVAARRERGSKGPDRKVYRLTEKGRDEVERWLRQPEAASDRGRDEFSAKLRFGLKRSRRRVGALVAARRRALESDHAADGERCESARQSRDAGLWLVAETRRRHTETALAALESCATLAGTHRSREPEGSAELVAIGSDDVLLDLLARTIAAGRRQIRFSAQAAGSLSGLIALREGRAQLAGIHLLDIDSGEYNVPFVKHLMPEERVFLMNLARREQGLMVAPGNPKGIRRLRDLVRPGVRLVNRQKGAGTRLLLFHLLRRARIDPSAIAGYEREAPTHNAVAAAVAAGAADVGPGIRAVAEAWGLGFIPLGEERYDLAIPRTVFESPQLRPLLEAVHQSSFRKAAAAVAGYDVTHMSEIVADIH